MVDPVIRAAFKLPAAAAVVAAIVDRLGRCRDSITLSVTFFLNAPYRDACESEEHVQDVPEINQSFALSNSNVSLVRNLHQTSSYFKTRIILLQIKIVINSFDILIGK